MGLTLEQKNEAYKRLKERSKAHNLNHNESHREYMANLTDEQRRLLKLEREYNLAGNRKGYNAVVDKLIALMPKNTSRQPSKYSREGKEQTYNCLTRTKSWM